MLVFIKQIIYYGSFLVFPFLYLLYRGWKRGVSRYILIPLLILAALFIDVRFIEPYLIIHNEHELVLSEQGTTTIRAVVYADPHIGVYRSGRQLARDVKKINALNPDIILIPGDFIYEIPADRLEDTFAAYKAFEAPAYAVAGNHDSEKPGDIKSEIVREAIEREELQFIDNERRAVEVNGQQLVLYGLSDIWEGETDFSLLNQITEEEQSIIVVHNPDAVHQFPHQRADLVVSGHTHGGQVRLPWLYKKAIPTEHDFDRWWYEFGHMKLFITTGTGMVGLPFRFLNPAQVDVIDIHL